MQTYVCVYVCLAVLGDRQRDDEAPGPLQTTHLINDCIHQHTSPTPCSPVYLSCSDLTRSVSLRSDVCIRSHVERDGCRLHSEKTALYSLVLGLTLRAPFSLWPFINLATFLHSVDSFSQSLKTAQLWLKVGSLL